MRVMFTLWPATAHLNTVVPLAWALQGAGHEVCVASHSDLADAITAAGLTAISLRGADSLPRPETVTDFVVSDEELERLTDSLALDPADRGPWDIFSYYLIAALRIFHPVDAAPQEPRPMVDDLVGFARHWRPDLVIWDPAWASGGVAARACGAASARLLWGPDYCGWTHDRFTERAGALPEGVENPMVGVARPMAERYGLQVDDAMLVGHWTIDPIPEEMRLPTTHHTLVMRRLPYTGAGVIPEWLRAQPDKQRIALSLGASQRTYDKDSEVLIADMLRMVADMDIEVIATLNDDQLAGQHVPGNVRTFDYIPLTQLLPTCSALIHHGGGGTYTSAVALKVPQLVLDEGAEAPGYAKCVTNRGAGLTLDYRKQSVAEMRAQLERVLQDPSFRKGAATLYEDWQAVPSPNAIVPVLEELTARHREH